MIHAGVIRKLLEKDAFPNFANVITAPFPEFGQLSHNFVSSASRAFGGFRTYFDDLRTGLRDIDVDIPPRVLRSEFLRNFIDGDLLSHLRSVGVNRGSAASSAAATASASTAGGAPNGGAFIPPL